MLRGELEPKKFLPDQGEALEHRHAMRTIAKGGAISIVGATVNAGLSLVLTMVLARSLSTVEAGVYFAITSTFLVLLGVSEFGSDVGLSRFIPKLAASGNPADARRIVRIAGALSSALAVGLCLIAMVGLWASPRVDSLAWAADSADVIWVILAVLPLAALSSTLLSAMRGHSRMLPAAVLGLMVRPALQTGLSVGLVLLGLAAIGPMAWAFVIPFAIVLLPAAFWYRSIAGRAGPGTDGHARGRTREVAWGYVAFTWPRAVTRILQILVQRGDVVVVAILASPKEAAIYAVATRAIVLGQFFGGALQQILAPQLSGLLSAGSERAARDVVKSTTVLSVMITWPVFLLCASMAPVVLDALGGSQYTTGALALALMGLAMCFSTLCGAADTVLLMGGRSRLSLANYSLAFLVDLVLLLVLVPRSGALGAALAWAGAIVIRNVLGVYQVRRLSGYWTTDRRALLVGGPAIVLFLVVPLLAGSWGMEFGAEAIGLSLASSMGYLCVLWLLRPRFFLSRRSQANTRERRSSPEEHRELRVSTSPELPESGS